jgi:hypothetical protein
MIKSEVRPEVKSRFTPASMNPDEFESPDLYSLIQRMKEDPAKFEPGDEKTRQIVIRRFPGYLKIALTTLRVQCIISGRPASMNLTICNCVGHSLPTFYSEDVLESLMQHKEDFKKAGATAKDSASHSYLSQSLDSFPFDIPTNDFLKPSRVSVVASTEMYNVVSDLADKLSIDRCDVVVMCCILALSRQNEGCNDAQPGLGNSRRQRPARGWSSWDSPRSKCSRGSTG